MISIKKKKGLNFRHKHEKINREHDEIFLIVLGSPKLFFKKNMIVNFQIFIVTPHLSG